MPLLPPAGLRRFQSVLDIASTVNLLVPSPPSFQYRQHGETEPPEDEVHHKSAQRGEGDAWKIHEPSFHNQKAVTKPCWASKESSLSSDSEVPWETFLVKTSSGHSSWVMTTLVPWPCAKNSTITRVMAKPKFAW